MAFCWTQGKDYAACLKNAVHFFVAYIKKINYRGVFPTCVRVGQRWCLKEKFLHRWDIFYNTRNSSEAYFLIIYEKFFWDLHLNDIHEILLRHIFLIIYEKFFWDILFNNTHEILLIHIFLIIYEKFFWDVFFFNNTRDTLLRYNFLIIYEKFFWHIHFNNTRGILVRRVF
jgi:hypothetical protein